MRQIAMVQGDSWLMRNWFSRSFGRSLRRSGRKYGDERRTEITEAPDEILPEDMIAQEEMVVTVIPRGLYKAKPA